METRTFDDNWHGGWRRFTLSDDRLLIRITSSGFLTREVTFFLRDLKRRYDPGWKRSSLLFLGSLMFLPGVGWLVGLRGLHNQRSVAVGVVLVLIGAIVIAMGTKKRSFATFYLQTGATAFDILSPRFSSDDEFRSFVAEIVARTPEEPNKAPEPTPLPVTPPAEPGVAPGSGVAHL